MDYRCDDSMLFANQTATAVIFLPSEFYNLFTKHKKMNPSMPRVINDKVLGYKCGQAF